MRRRLTSRGSVVMAAAVSALAVLALARQPWATGTIGATAGVPGGGAVEVTGSEAAPGLVGLALLLAAGALAAATTGRIGRILGVLAMWAGALGLVALVADVILDPGSALSVRAAALSGITGEVGTTGHRLTWTPWAALAVGALALLAAAAATLGLQSWSGLSSRYDSPTTVTAGARGERVGTDWDRLSAGEDPTLGPDDAPHEPRS